jgi:hypothetical protein
VTPYVTRLLGAAQPLTFGNWRAWTVGRFSNVGAVHGPPIFSPAYTLGHVNDPDALAQVIRDGTRNDRAYAVAKLIALHDSASVAILGEVAHRRGDEERLACQATVALGSFDTPESIQALIEIAGTRDSLMREAAARALGSRPTKPSQRLSRCSTIPASQSAQPPSEPSPGSKTQPPRKILQPRWLMRTTLFAVTPGTLSSAWVPPTNSTPTAPDGYPCGPSTSCAHEPTRAISQTVNLIRAQFRTPSVAMRSSADRRLGEKSTSPRRLDAAVSRTLETMYRQRREFCWFVEAATCEPEP